MHYTNHESVICIGIKSHHKNDILLIPIMCIGQQSGKADRFPVVFQVIVSRLYSVVWQGKNHWVTIRAEKGSGNGNDAAEARVRKARSKLESKKYTHE